MEGKNPAREEQIRDVLIDIDTAGGAHGIGEAWEQVNARGVRAGLAEVGVVIARVNKGEEPGRSGPESR